MATPNLPSRPSFTLRFSPAGDIHATIDAIRAELDRWDSRLFTPPTPIQDNGGPVLPSNDMPPSPLS